MFKIPNQIVDKNKKFEDMNKKFEETEKEMTNIKYETRYLQRKRKDLTNPKQPQQEAAEEFQLATPKSSKAICPQCKTNYTKGHSDFCRICSRARTSEE